MRPDNEPNGPDLVAYGWDEVEDQCPRHISTSLRTGKPVVRRGRKAMGPGGSLPACQVAEGLSVKQRLIVGGLESAVRRPLLSRRPETRRLSP